MPVSSDYGTDSQGSYGVIHVFWQTEISNFRKKLLKLNYFTVQRLKSLNIPKLIYFQNQQRELTVRHAKEQDKEMKKRLDVQKEEYEAAIKRHLSFIDQVIGILHLKHIFPL